MKTVEEWSNAFDVLVASYIRNSRFGFTDPLVFDEYEKSLFLTKAQEELVQSIYNGNSTINSFEETEYLRKQLSSLISQFKGKSTKIDTGLHDKYYHYLYELPENCWFIIYEQAITIEASKVCKAPRVVEIYPTTHDEYSKIIKNPFRGPNDYRALRLDNGDKKVEIVSKLELTEYTARYLSKPIPIVLEDFSSENLSIEGVNTPSTCTLPEMVHQNILNYAVQLAVNSRLSGNNNK